MIHQAVKATAYGLPAPGAVGDPFYVVPSPKAQAPGVGRDGRLHMLLLELTPVGVGNMGCVTLDYIAEDGSLVGRFTDSQLNFATSNANPLYIGWASEPGGVGFGDVSVGSLASGGSWGAGAFTWLQAGMGIALGFIDSGFAWNVSILSAIVEDFGQLGQGDEYDVGPREAGGSGSTFLLPDAD